MTISVDLVCEGTALIIAHKTGIKYEAQCDGIGCAHPEAEGFVLSLGSFMSDFDDCSFGCTWMREMPESQMKLATALDISLREKTRNWKYLISFDFNRVGELMEGWWPVVIEGVLDDWNKTEGRFMGYLHTGNCD